MRSEAGVLLIEGAVTIDTVSDMVEEVEGYLAAGVSAVDLSKVTEVDSAAVALALEWRRRADKRGIALKWTNLPAAFQNLANLYGVTDLLSSEA